MRETKYLKDDIQNIQKLATVPIFKDFETEILRELLKLSKIREYEDDELIIREGELDHWLYFLFSGSVKITKKGNVLKVLKRKWDIFGEMAIVGGIDRSASV
ncbi:cyclic nucleotide-binding domain-containing protein [Thermodesulfobacteriota bacterium]